MVKTLRLAMKTSVTIDFYILFHIEGDSLKVLLLLYRLIESGWDSKDTDVIIMKLLISQASIKA